MWTSLIPLPYRWAIIAALFAAATGFGWVKGAEHDHAKWEAADALRYKQDAAHLAADTARAKANTDKLRALFDSAADLRYKENTKHEADLANLAARARAGSERLHCPAATLPANATPDDPAAVSRSGDQGRPGDVMPQTAADLFGIGASITRIVRDKNALIDAYNAARETCNAP